MTSKFQGLLDLIKPASSGVRNPSIFVYGPTGSGKTHFAGSFDETHEVLIVTAENGAMTVADRDVKILPIDPHGQGVVSGFKTVLEFLKAIATSQTQSGKPRAIILDTLSSAQETMKRELQRSRGGKLDQRAWGVVIDWTLYVAREMANLQCTTVTICHSSEEKDEKTGEVFVRPSVYGKKTPNLVNAEYDFSVYTKRTSVEGEDGKPQTAYVMLTSYPGERYLVKDRSGKLPQVVENDYNVWHELLHGEDEGLRDET